MRDVLVAALVVLLGVQFVLWVLVEIDVRGVDDPDLRWLAVAALFPVVGLVASTWYVGGEGQLFYPTDRFRDGGYEYADTDADWFPWGVYVIKLERSAAAATEPDARVAAG
jgi:Ni/Fe-hydrogenase subunit HybB-like protein